MKKPNFTALAETYFKEAQEPDPGVLKQIKSMTHNNDHTGALIAAAKMLGLREMQKAFEAVEAIAKFENHLPSEINDYRYGLSKKMLSYAEHHLSKEGYAALYASF